MTVERGGSAGPPLRFSAQNAAGARKKPRRERTGEVCPPSRARNQAREPRRRETRAGAGAGAQAHYARNRDPPPGAPRPAAALTAGSGTAWNETRWRERYAGTEPQSFSGGMGNMTFHDTIQGSSMKSPLPACSFLLLPRLRGRPGGGPLGVTGGCRGFARRFRRRKRPLTLPSPGGRGSSGACVFLLSVMGTGVAPAFAGATMGDKCPPAASRGQSGARTAPAQNARRRARARTQDTRAKRVPPLERRRGRKGMECNGTEGAICRNGTAELRRRHGEHDNS